jgi:hypothetical protein
LVEDRADGRVVIGYQYASQAFHPLQAVPSGPASIPRYMGMRTRRSCDVVVIAFDDPAVIADDLGDQRKAKAGSAGLVVTNGRTGAQQVIRYARPLS